MYYEAQTQIFKQQLNMEMTFLTCADTGQRVAPGDLRAQIKKERLMEMNCWYAKLLKPYYHNGNGNVMP